MRARLHGYEPPTPLIVSPRLESLEPQGLTTLVAMDHDGRRPVTARTRRRSEPAPADGPADIGATAAEAVEEALAPADEGPAISALVDEAPIIGALAVEATASKPQGAFTYLFPALETDATAHLPSGAATISALHLLGAAMVDAAEPGDSPIPAAFTYLGQFIDHDITAEHFANPADGDITRASFVPLQPDVAKRVVVNKRSAELDLDSVYGAPETRKVVVDGASIVCRSLKSSREFEIGQVTAAGDPVPGKGPDNDLPRLPPLPDDPVQDRSAIIGDERNDENLLIAQLHVAFLRAHNALMGGEEGVEAAAAARRALVRRYQYAVLEDFLPRLCDPAQLKIVKAAKADDLLLKPLGDGRLAIPFEFSVAAYRFGHSMIRHLYDHNVNFPRATLEQLFTFTALSGDFVAELPTLPQNWVIQWERFVDGPELVNRARAIDTFLTPALFGMPKTDGAPETIPMARLATRNLLRGYLLSLPTGQAVARHLNELTAKTNATIEDPAERQPLIDVLEGKALLNAVRSEAQRDALLSSGGLLLEKTPLWFYILAEAGDPSGPKGEHLGPVGSRIIAETFCALVWRSEHSVLVTPPDAAELASGGFSLRGILELSGNLAPIG